MKRVTASEARRYWFRLLDEVVAGEVVVIDRDGTRVVLKRQDSELEHEKKPPPDYRSLFKVHDLDNADAWTWEWEGPGRELRFRKRRRP